MKEIIHLALRTEYSFKNVFGHLKETLTKYNIDGIIGVADDDNLYASSEIERFCNDNEDVDPIYGIRLKVCKNAFERVKPRGVFGREYILWNLTLFLKCLK